MRVFELRQKIKAKKDEGKRLLEVADAENRDLNDAENQAFQQLLADVRALEQRVQQLEQLDAEEDDQSTEAPARKSVPIAMEARSPAVHVDKSKRQYSLLRAISRQLEGRLDGYEREVSDEIALRSGKNPQGFYMPTDLSIRALNTTTGTGGIVTTYDTDYISLLRARTVVIQAGATVLNGMRGNFAIPRITGAATAAWVTEGNCPAASNQTLDQVVFTPKTVSAYTDVTRKFMLQVSADAENLVRQDLVAVIARAIDTAALNGSGGNDPLGLLQDTAVPTVAIGTNGGAPTWSNAVALEAQVAEANADFGALAYITDAQVRATMKTTPKIGTTYPIFVIEADGSLNGHPVFVSQLVPANLTKGTGTALSAMVYGNWNDLVIATWGDGLDILIDPYTGSCSGSVRIVALQDVDCHPRHPLSFAKTVDLSTSGF